MAKTVTRGGASSGPGVDAAVAKQLLTDMLLIRRFEEKAAEAYTLGKIGGFLHLYIGEEAVADGAVPEGEFHESMNLAALWKLPVIFLCENNRYAMGTSVERALAQTEIWRFGQTYGVSSERVDGMDVLAVREAVARAVTRARQHKTPALLEADTYRYRGHSMRDPAGAVYRTKEEVEREKLRDPIVLFRDKLLAAGLLAEADVRAIEKDVNDRVDEAVAFADASPEPPGEWLFTDIYKEP